MRVRSRAWTPLWRAAAIGVGGTVVVGVAGFSAVIWNTRRTIAYARESRVWEKRAAAYEAILAAFRHRASARHFQFDMFKLPEQANEKALDIIREAEPPGWYEAVGRLFAYGSDDVLTAFEAAQDADRLAAKGYLTWNTLGEQHEAMYEALKVAEQKDEALLQLIRSELRSRPDLDREDP